MKKVLSIILAAFLVLLMANPAWAMWLTLKKGTTSKIIQIPIYDSSSTTGGMLTGLTYNSSGLTAYYNREGAAGAATSITLATATKGTWASGGFVAVDGTNMPGWYELDIPDAALATGANSVSIHVKGATNMVPVTILIQLVDNVSADVYSEVTNASYGLAKLVRSTTPANTLDVSATGESGLDFSNVKQATGSTTLSNITIPTVTGITNPVTVGTNNDKTGYTASTVTDKTGYSLTQTFPSNFSALAITAGGAVTVGTNNDKTGYTVSTNQDKAGYTVSTVQDKSGYSLSQTFPANFSAMAITAGGAVTSGTVNDKTGYTVSTVQDKTGYSLTQAFPSNFSSMAITAGGAVTAGTVNDKAGYSLSASGVDAVWDELTTGHTTIGSYGKLFTDNIDAAISSRSTYSGGAVASVTGNVGGTVNGLTATAKTDVENAVWEATASSHNSAGTMGNKLNSAASAGDPWNTSLPGSYGAGTAGYILGTNLNATVASRSTLTAANVWQTDLSGYSTANQAGTLLKGAGSAGDPWSTAIPGSYGAGTAGYIVGNNLNATVASRSSHSASDVWAVGTRTITGGTATSVTNGVTVTTNNDKTGYSLTQAFPINFSSLAIDSSGRMDLGKWVGNAPNALISGRVDSNAQVVGDKTGYSLTQSFPTNFSSLAITAGGAVTVGTNNDKTGYGLTSAGEDSIVNKVWDEPRSGHITAGSFGQGVASVQGNVTGSVNSVSGSVTVGINNDKTGYSLTQSFPTNFSSLGITVGGAVTVGTNNDKTGYALTSAEEDAIVDKVWNELRSGHTTAGSFGQGIASVQGNVTGSVNSVTSAVTVGTNNDKTGYGLSASSIDDIWNESQAGHTSVGTFGYFLDSRVSDAGGSLTADDVADAVWDETAADHSATGTTGKKLLDASLAGDPWATSLPGSYTGSQAGFYLQDLIKKSRGR